MRNALIVLLTSLCLSVLLPGCSDRGSGRAPVTPAGYGSVSFTVNWPETAQYGARVIPASAVTIAVTVTRNGSQVGQITITRPATSGTINSIPAGTALVSAAAKDGGGATVAWGSTAVTVLAGQTVTARLVLYEFSGSINPIDGAEMVWVPGGAFTMGTEYAWWDPPLTQQVTLSGYWIYKYEVTVAQYRAFCAATGRVLPFWPGNTWSWAGKSGWADPALQHHPIVNVTWYDARDYAAWAGVTLPTEAQWEYAARGPQGNNYPWGGTATAADPYNGWDETKCANYYNSYMQNISTWPVGSFPAGASWCGAHDLAGNVWEWCADWYGPYSMTPVTNPTGPATGDYRVLRGGSWGSGGPWFFRAAYRGGIDPWGRVGGMGFRCVVLSPGP